MTAPPARFVMDASVAVKLFLRESLSDNAHRLLRPASVRPPLAVFVPELFFVECANVFWKRARRGDITTSVANRCYRDLLGLPFRVTSTTGLASTVLRMAFRFGVTAYDATYVVAAEALGVPLVTADEALARTFARGMRDVLWLGRF